MQYAYNTLRFQGIRWINPKSCILDPEQNDLLRRNLRKNGKVVKMIDIQPIQHMHMQRTRYAINTPSFFFFLSLCHLLFCQGRA